MGYKSVVWTDSPIGSVVTERLPSQASSGTGASFYTSDLVLSYQAKPEYESIAAFLQFKSDDESSDFDWKDITGLVTVTKRSASAVKSDLLAAGLTLRTYRPTGVGEKFREYRQRISEESVMASKIETFALVASSVVGKLPEDSQAMLLATVRFVNEQGYEKLVNEMSDSDKSSAMVELACANIRAGNVSAALDAILSAARAASKDGKKSDAQVIREKAEDAARVAKRLAEKARIYTLAEQSAKPSEPKAE